MTRKILFFITIDRLAPTDLACYGNRETQTPHLDKLVLDGIVFDEHYSSASFPDTARNDWLSGQPFLEQGPASKNELGKILALNHIELTQIDAADAQFSEQIQRFFHCTIRKGSHLLWLRLATQAGADSFGRANQLENIITRLQRHLDDLGELPLAWLITSEQGILPEELPDNTSSVYAEQLRQSLSRKLWRPLILSGNDLPDDYPQRGQSLSVSQDIHWTILELLNCEFPVNSPPHSLLTGIDQQQERQLFLLDEHRVGLRTPSELIVIPNDANETEANNANEVNEAIAPMSAKYYLKPEDRNDLNDLSSTVPELLEKHVATLRQFLEKLHSKQ